jgi:protein-disulfide isomerase
MSKNLKISLALVAAAVAAVLAFAFTGGDDGESDAQPARTKSERVVRPDSQKLSVAEDGKVTFVEFLDYECEACRAAHPAIEQLRETYEGKVTFVVRNMPLHNNSQRAAQAAEAAAAQGKFEEMYDLLFETQPNWGESSDSQEEVFFGLAEQLGLDMGEFEQVYNDPATAERVKRDLADGKALGVEGTPSFFINGDKVEVESFNDLVAKIDAELGE